MKQYAFLPSLLIAAVALCPCLTSAQSANASVELETQDAQKVSNVFLDTYITQALQDLAVTAKVTIVPDETVQGTVSCEFKDITLEKALDIVLAAGGYSWVEMDGFYLVGMAEPMNPNFLLFAKTQLYKPSHMTGELVLALLPEPMLQYVKAAQDSLFLTITASSRMMTRILADMRLIDVAPKRILLEVLITDISTETLDQFDLSWIWKNFGVSGNGEGMELTYSAASQNDVVTLKAMIAAGMAEVRANPRIMTLEGQEAMVEVAQESYFQVVSGPVNFPYTTLQVIKTGILLRMTPTITDDGQVTVKLMPEVSDAIGSGSSGLPINTVRRADTIVRVKSGETIVIGGMTYESTRRKEQRIPILSDIPIIGQLFRSHRYETRKMEIVIMITPYILSEDEDASTSTYPAITTSGEALAESKAPPVLKGVKKEKPKVRDKNKYRKVFGGWSF